MSEKYTLLPLFDTVQNISATPGLYRKNHPRPLPIGFVKGIPKSDLALRRTKF
ncbi:MAG: hypothetical protein NTU49_06460 [Gammaproteobacteria bacterium]|nr:hypothetical protein [Gammaproteobacteria bacterium]